MAGIFRFSSGSPKGTGMRRVKMAVVFVWCLVGLAGARLLAQGQGGNGNISGTVTDASGRAVLVGAEVTVEGLGRKVSTDDSGRYVLVGVPAGKAKVVVSYLGLET